MTNREESIERAALSVAKMVDEFCDLGRNDEGLKELAYLIDRRLRRFISFFPVPDTSSLEVDEVVAAYERACVHTYIPDIPRSPVRTKEWLAGQKAGFGAGLNAGKEIMRAALTSGEKKE